jgi:hypothetical protein
MKTKSILTALCSALTMILTSSTAVFAASSQKVYSSGILVLVFIGFVALVVVVQMIPAILTLCGMLKGLANDRKTAAAEARTK